MSTDAKIGEVEEGAIEKPKQVVTFWHIYFLGMAMKLGGFAMGWNYGLVAGFWEYFYALIVIGIGYSMLGLCMAEMVSIMSFSGGYYGYARCAIGPLGGFLVGCSGAMESIFYLAMYVLKIGQFCTIVFNMDEKNQPYVWILTYFTLILFHLVVGKQFWNMSLLIGMGVTTLILIHLFGTMGDLDFDKFALIENTGYHGGPDEFFNVFRLAVLFFLGFDMITLTSSEVSNPKVDIPRAMLALISTLFLLAIWTMFTVASQYPGVTDELYGTDTLFPLVFGYEKIFNIGRKQATVIAAIPTFATAMGYLHIVGRQIKSMATSGLMPSFLKTAYGTEGTPIVAMIFVACFALGGNYFAWREGVYTTTSRISTIAGCFVYLAMFYCFYTFRRRYGHLERGFHNPLGYFSAILGGFIFLAVLIILLYFHESQFYPVTLWYFTYIGVMLFYYYAYAESHQCFSHSEQKVFFKAYILNMQRRKKKAMHRRFASDIFSLFLSSVMPASSRRSADHNGSLNSSDRNKTPQTPKKTTSLTANKPSGSDNNPSTSRPSGRKSSRIVPINPDSEADFTDLNDLDGIEEVLSCCNEEKEREDLYKEGLASEIARDDMSLAEKEVVELQHDQHVTDLDLKMMGDNPF